MATRTVHIKITQPDAEGNEQPWGGTVTWAPHGPGAVRTGEDAIIMPEPFAVGLVDGEATVTVERDDLASWCWCVRWSRETRYVTVPAGTSTIEFKDLPQIDPGTFTAVPPVTVLTALSDQLAAMEAAMDGYQPAGDYALAATVASFPVLCVWSGTAWTTLAGVAVPTNPALVRWYDSTQHDTAGVTTPTHYNDRDKWYRKPAV